MKLYVGNLPFSITEEVLHAEFSAHGNVVSAKIITDRETGRARGFGFVEMGSVKDGQNAISQMNGKMIDGREISVNEARPQEARGGGGGGGGGGGRGGRDNRGGGGGGRY